MFKKLFLSLAILGLSSSSLFANKVGLGINLFDDSYELQASYEADLQNSNTLYTEFTFYDANEDNNTLDWKSYELLVAPQKTIDTSFPESDFTIRLGFKPTYLKLNDFDSLAVPLQVGGILHYDRFAFPLGFVAAFDYAPDILSFNDLDSYFGYNFEVFVDFDIGKLSVGYKNVTVDTNAGSHLLKNEYDIKDSAYIGFKIQF